MPKYLVETVSIFRMRYVVDAACEDYAKDEVLMNKEIEEFSQCHLDEVISDAIEITDAEYLVRFDRDNDYLKNWTDEQKFRRVNIVT